MAAVNIKRGNIDIYLGTARSFLSKRKHFRIVRCALIRDRNGRCWLICTAEEKQRTCYWKAFRYSGEVIMAVEAHGITVVAGKSISATL